MGIRFIICLVTAVLLLGGKVFALSGKEHCRDMLEVLGPEKSQRCASLAEAVTQMMDENYTRLLDDIKSPMVADGHFTLSRYSHRLFFHWGFNQNPRSQSALAEQVRRAVESQNLMVQQEARTGADITRLPIKEDAIWKLIEKEWKKRRLDVLSKAACLGGSKSEREAVVTIMYHVHLLGDYSTNAVEALADLRKVIAPELCQAIGVIGKQSPQAGQLSRQIKASSSRAYSTASQRRCAEKLLTLLKQELPGILQNSSIR